MLAPGTPTDRSPPPVAADHAAHEAAMAAMMAVESLPVEVALLDPEGIVRVASRAWLSDDSGSPSGDAVGIDHLRRLTSTRGRMAGACRAWADRIHAVVAGRAANARLEYEVTRDGHRLAIRATAWAVVVQGRRWVVVRHEDRTPALRLSSLERAAQHAAMQREQADADARRQQRVLEQFSQRLGVPATPIVMQLHMLQKGHLGPITPRQRAAIDQVARNVQRWTATCAALEHALQAADQRPADLRDVVEEAVASARTRAIQQGVRLRVDQGDQRCPVALGQETARSILDALIDRALAVTGAGLEVVVRTNCDGQHCVVEVVDAGPPIDHGDASRLFDPAHVATDPTVAALVRMDALAHAVGGRAWAEPAGPAAGTVVGLALPWRNDP